MTDEIKRRVTVAPCGGGPARRRPRRRGAPVARTRPAALVQFAGASAQAEQPVPLERPRQGQSAGRRRPKSRSGRNRARRRPAGSSGGRARRASRDGTRHQGGADAAAAAVRIGRRAGRAAAPAGRDRPTRATAAPCRPSGRARWRRRTGLGRQPAFAQPLGGLGEAGGAEARSSSASRAAMSDGRSCRIATMAAPGDQSVRDQIWGGQASGAGMQNRAQRQF